MSVIRAFLVFVPTAAITVLLGTPFTVQQALAKPISVPSSPRVFGGLANFAAGRPGTDSDRSPSPRHLFSHATVALIKSPRLPSRILTRHVERKAARSGPPALLERVPTCASTPRNLNVSSDKIALLQIYYLQALQCAESYQNLASQATSASAANPAFQQHASSELSGFSTNFKGFTTVLAELGTDKGTANLDPTNDVETLLKNIVNANKDVLTVTYDLVDSLPIVGPNLGPTVYEVKCILDDLLDIVENLSDAIINAIQPLLQAVLGKAVTTICRSGVQVAGLCI